MSPGCVESLDLISPPKGCGVDVGLDYILWRSTEEG